MWRKFCSSLGGLCQKRDLLVEQKNPQAAIAGGVRQLMRL